MKFKIGFVLGLLAVMLAGCGRSPAEISGTSVEVAGSTAESTSAVTTTAVSEEVTFCGEEVFSEIPETSATIASAVLETEAVGSPKVYPANEVYDVYPKRIIYPEKTQTNITAEKAFIEEGFEKGGKTVVAFTAEYPVFSGGDEAVMRKINDGIKAYIDGIYNEEKERAAGYELPEVKEDAEFDFPYDMCGFYIQRTVSDGEYYSYTDDFDVNGNILSIYFEDYSYGAGAAHGSGTPVPMMFDLRTGERVFFSDFIEDRDGLSETLSKALYDHQYAYTNSAVSRENADKYAEFNEKRISGGFTHSYSLEFGTDEDGSYITAYCRADDRVIIREGCVCIYLAPYEYGSHADGIRRVDASAEDIYPYLNEAGRSLLEGYSSAETEPVNVIEHGGKRYFDNMFPRLTMEVETVDYSYYWQNCLFPPRFLELTDADYEFMGLFSDVRHIELHGCENVDFEKLAKIKNIENITSLELEYCKFGDISPLIGLNIHDIYGSGNNMPKEQAEKFEAQGDDYYVSNQLIS